MTMKDYETWQFEREHQVGRCCDCTRQRIYYLLFYSRPIQSRDQSPMTRMDLPFDLFTKSGRACNSNVPFRIPIWMKAMLVNYSFGKRVSLLAGNHVRAWGSWGILFVRCLETCFDYTSKTLPRQRQCRGSIHRHFIHSQFSWSRSL